MTVPLDQNLLQTFVALVRDIYQTDEFIPLHAPVFGEEEKRLVVETIESTFVSTVGKCVTEIENQFAEYTGADFAIATCNGTAALHVALLLAGVQPGDLVLTQPLSFVATGNAITYAGAQPVFVDVDRDTLGLSPAALKQFLIQQTKQESNQPVDKKSGRRISACVPMHTFGFPADIRGITNVCREFNIPIVEDAAESLGSQVDSQHMGSFGELGTVSFNGNKIITSGGGGVILTSNEELAKRGKHLTTTAKENHAWEYYHRETGFNYRMPNLNAALLSAQMERLPDFLKSKRKIADSYCEFFTDTKIEFHHEQENTVANYWLNTILLANLEQRNEFLEFTNSQGVMTRPAWHLLNQLPMFASCHCDPIPNAEFFAERIVNIPSSPIIESS